MSPSAGPRAPTAPALPAPDRVLHEGRYEVRFAAGAEELDAAQRLRFAVFNLELGEGLDASYESGRDADEFDPVCHHLLVVERTAGEIVGSYRMQTAAMAEANRGFYTDGLFELADLPGPVLARSIEVGRACVAREHRSTQVLFLLWKGLAMYVAHNRARHLFGCCSLTSQDPRVGWAVMRRLEAGGHRHPELTVRPRPHCLLPAAPPGSERGVGPPAPPTEVAPSPAGELPVLFRTYLRYGAKVVSPPAIDREFKTIDFLVMLDVESLRRRTHRMFFGQV